ncbi:Amidohydrolase [Colletotrichum higginsianum IMI 349063]|uniref:Amidohydrolase n=4 Tax=Colletotrichum destructivum species complex TaxID=2707350 RepID=A0A1B7YGA1_COLHI|nr:Amidohydrolase [Colletotrichum higginsianum IMI 349063]OBR10914.1 Amidohydrolase [Colletotrichum higginsianum IMI 349063]TID07714.1 hypothetical protein CH35J_000831 [Colletotrichum higginsianum]WQF86479.1 hypothetical protein CDEST_11493 [Colletotrichum destructivum]
MHFSTLFLSTALMAAGSVLGAPPAPLAERTPVAESIVNATALGIDVYGAIPEDAVKVADGHYTAEPGTNAWAWIRAQIDLPDTAHTRSENEKRQWANIGIGMFAQDWCNGQSSWFDNVQYNVHHVDAVNMFSVGISYRGLRGNEQLDFSRRSGNGDLCGQYLYSAQPNTPIGCFNSQLINCFNLKFR